MKKRNILLVACAILTVTVSSYARGPFDNGEYSQFFGQAGLYQASIRMTNGQGYCSFRDGDEFVNTVPVVPTQNNPNPLPSLASISNRSVIFYKGIVYYGSCTGIVDTSSKSIEAITNGWSDASNASLTQTTGTLGNDDIPGSVPNEVDPSITATQVNALTASRGITLVANGKGYFCNTAWHANVTSTAPIYRFQGTGTLVAFGDDTSQHLFEQIAVQFKTDIQTQINAMLSKDPTGLTDQQVAKNQLTALLGTIDGYMGLVNRTLGSADPFKNLTTGPDSVKITVRGIRKFL